MHVKRINRPVVTLGAGHGGFDCGVVGPSGIKEKEVALRLATRTRSLLERTGALEAVLTRADDVCLETDERVSLVREAGSACHIEFHAGLFTGAESSALVFYSAALPGDRPFAALLSRRVAAALRIRDGGALQRPDCGPLQRARIRHEDYFSLVEQLAALGVPHVFYLQCGMLDDPFTQARLASPRGIDAVARAAAHTVCAVLDAPCRHLPPRFLPVPASAFDIDGRPVYLRGGLFRLHAGPGGATRALRDVHGLCHVCAYAEESGWMKVSLTNEEYLSAAAADRRLRLTGDTPPVRSEAVLPGALYYVRAAPDTHAEILGVIGGGDVWRTVCENGWRRIGYGERIGYVGPFAWEKGE